jgi:peptidoglycan/LPS O-acetylase OafA/YrhL
MTDTREHPPPATTPAAPEVRALAASGPGRVVGLAGIRGLAAVFVVLSHIFERAWRILPPYWAAPGFSLVMTWYVLAQPGWPVPNGKSVLMTRPVPG